MFFVVVLIITVGTDDGAVSLVVFNETILVLLRACKRTFVGSSVWVRLLNFRDGGGGGGGTVLVVVGEVVVQVFDVVVTCNVVDGFKVVDF